MANLMTNIYIAYVEEIIYKDGLPTLGLRVRIPTIHGTNSTTGLSREQLPIAKPIFPLGFTYKISALENALKKINKVFVMFESGDQNKPVYFGLKGNEDLYEIPNDQTVEVIEAPPSDPEDPDSPPTQPPIVISSRENKTFAQVTDPATQVSVVNGDLWFDTATTYEGENTLENPITGEDPEPETLPNPSEPEDDIDDIVDTI